MKKFDKFGRLKKHAFGRMNNDCVIFLSNFYRLPNDEFNCPKFISLIQKFVEVRIQYFGVE